MEWKSLKEEALKNIKEAIAGYVAALEMYNHVMKYSIRIIVDKCQT